MEHERLRKLDDAVAALLGRPSVREAIASLQKAITQTSETFVWSVVDCGAIAGLLPPDIASGWIFLLKRNTPTGAHYHPNSVQHMVMVAGEGWSEVAGERRRMLPFRAPGKALSDISYVIDPSVPHEFFPEERDMVVISFHTCPAGELQETSCATGETRFYSHALGVS